MRILSACIACFAVTALGACGAGGGTEPLAMARVSGTVTSVDGSTLSRSGIVVVSKGTGALAVTGADGTFTIEVPAGDPIRIEFDDPKHPDGPGGDVDEKDDVTHDGTDIDGDEVQLDPLGDDEHCKIEVDIENGEVTECRVEHPDRKDGDGRVEFEAECRLKPVDGSSEPEAVAEAELVCTDDCCILEIEVGHVFFNDSLTVVLECEEAREELGSIEIVENGGHFELEHCFEDGGEPLPFGAESIKALAGCWLLLVDGEGQVALVGCVPGRDDDGEEEKPDGHDKPDRFVEDARLEPVDGSSEPDAEGGAVVICEEDCCTIVVEVGGVESSEQMTVVISCEGERYELAAMEIVEGQGRIEVEFCGDTPRPFGVESLRKLGGCELLVLDGQGEVALAGAFPGKSGHDEE